MEMQMSDHRSAPEGEYLTDAQLRELLQVTERTTIRWRNSALGPPFIRAGLRRVLYRRSDVEQWLAQRTFRHRAAELASKAEA